MVKSRTQNRTNLRDWPDAPLKVPVSGQAIYGNDWYDSVDEERPWGRVKAAWIT